MTNLRDNLKADILMEFKQVLKLAPADYTENCTNVVLSIVDDFITNQVKQAQINELHKIPRINYGNDFAIHINAYLDNRIKELEQ